MKNAKFGIEIEFTGITRDKAATVLAGHLNGTTQAYGDEIKIKAADGRIWKITRDGSINSQTKRNGTKVGASDAYRCELVSPILTYESDIDTVQELVRKLRKAGAFTNNSCGIHIHLDGADHNANSIKNFINIIASKNDLFYEALQIAPARASYCKKMDEALVAKINTGTVNTLQQIEDIWYDGYSDSRTRHYHQSRYHFLNLHSFFTRNHTVELRGFNSELHAGKIRSYILLALALNHQALTQKKASPKKSQAHNPKFAMRTYLNRIGFIGDEFKNCREHLTSHLQGSAAWRYRGSRAA